MVSCLGDSFWHFYGLYDFSDPGDYLGLDVGFELGHAVPLRTDLGLVEVFELLCSCELMRELTDHVVLELFIPHFVNDNV